ncbi:hypothetical protein B9Z39_09120 [Limnohabitans sp. JirII-29]|uniref:type 4b pilus protein PilO2 n=1 Tax=Limnohabitans sp. JirII-29 TaxID=1835756 RepID=UPI000D398002|nr:type 4b pilus protein PilO2 [Limnohabitans sp. JirII-29]PUE27893.1 hypothetical protein B9Z39_09120 [Limnohabitans sp. JirII-29]
MAALSLSSLWPKKGLTKALPSIREADRLAARTLQFLQSANGSRTLVLGLNWRAILISGGVNSALEKARQAGATHYCMVGVQTVAYGKVPSNKNQALIPEKAYPAALLASRMTSSEGFFALTLSSTEVWVVAIRNGRPHGFDEVLIDPSGNLAGLTRDWLLTKTDQCASASVYTDVDIGLMDVKPQPCSLASLMSSTAMASDILRVLPPSSWLTKIQIPKPVMQLGGVVVVLWLSNYAYELWNAHAKEQAEVALAVLQKQSDDPILRWRQVLDELSASHVDPNAENFSEVRKRLGQLPANWKNWKLLSAYCKAQSVVARKQTWNCSASYGPQTSVDVATNLELNAAAPEGFKAKFVTMKQASLEWSVTGNVQPLNISKLPTRQVHLLDTTSLLQRYSPVMSSVSEVVFTSLKVTPPKTSLGTEIIKPANLYVPSEAPLTIRGPLRTIDALVQRDLSAEWRAISFSYIEGGIDKDRPLSSVLEAQLDGVLYAKD